MRRHKWKLLVTLAGLVVLTGAAALVLWPRPDRITLENFLRVRKGMGRAEVEAILGSPGDYTTGPIVPWTTSGNLIIASGPWTSWGEAEDNPVTTARGVAELRHPDGTLTCNWEGDTRAIWVTFGRSGDAVYGDTCPSALDRARGPLDRLLWRAKRQWRRWFP
jgi:hypothetical protein